MKNTNFVWMISNRWESLRKWRCIQHRNQNISIKITKTKKRVKAKHHTQRLIPIPLIMSICFRSYPMRVILINVVVVCHSNFVHWYAFFEFFSFLQAQTNLWCTGCIAPNSRHYSKAKLIDQFTCRKFSFRNKDINQSLFRNSETFHKLETITSRKKIPA